MCQTCEDGDNTDYLSEIGSCTFGCGNVVDTDVYYCRYCSDHSANVAVCEDCGAEYDDANGEWEASVVYK